MTTASPSRAAPIPASGGVLGWMRANLFNSIGGGIVTLITLYVLVSLLVPFIRWALIDAVWHAENARACHAAGTGACWAFIGEKWRFILFGRYPYEEQWRSALVSVLFFLLVGATCVPSLWRRELLYVWAAVIILNAWLMMGGMLGLSPVPTDLWSGLPLTLILALFSMILGFPLAVLLALGRRSSLPIIRAFSTGFIELMRGVPLITVLFMASLMIPLFLPSGVSIDKTLRALVGITLFLAAYLAEDVRAGLMALPKGQIEAADALGLGYWRKTFLVVLPQAITIVIPPMVGNFIGNFKNTSLVLIIGLFDLMMTAQTSLVDPNWRGLTAEAYLFVLVIYFAVCYSMSRYSRALERRFNKTNRR